MTIGHSPRFTPLPQFTVSRTLENHVPKQLSKTRLPHSPSQSSSGCEIRFIDIAPPTRGQITVPKSATIRAELHSINRLRIVGPIITHHEQDRRLAAARVWLFV